MKEELISIREKQKTCPKRIIGLDFIRSAAILFVLSNHFFGNTSFHKDLFESSLSTFVQMTVYPIFLTGVPLFIILTGYLNVNKIVSKHYYKGCIRVLFAYLLFSIVTILFRIFYLHESLTCRQWVGEFPRFHAIPYGWYIEMWIGLFLLTPFLNLLYKAIPTKRQKEIWLLTLFVLTAVPNLFNRFGFHLVPGFWNSCFPLLYFYIGSYLSEYKPYFEKRKLGFILLLLCLINPIFNILFRDNQTFVLIAGDPSGAIEAMISIIFFLMFYQIDFSSSIIRKSLTRISLLSLDMYLCCYIFDALVYPYFLSRYFANHSQFGIYFFVIIPILFAGSFAMAWVKDCICKRISKQL